jgi:peroxiredoxin Q/BCP
MLRTLIASLVLLSAASAQAQQTQLDDKPVVKVGDKAPSFRALDDAGKRWRSRDHVGKKILVVYFYPADMTGGCTAQACAYRDAAEDLKAKDVEVIGVSGDSVENHQVFKKHHKLNFTLLADPDGKIAKSFGVKLVPGGAVDKDPQGQPILKDGQPFTMHRGVTAMRWTFVIDKDGKVVHKDDKVNAAKDAENILKVVNKLRAEDADKDAS